MEIIEKHIATTPYRYTEVVRHQLTISCPGEPGHGRVFYRELIKVREKVESKRFTPDVIIQYYFDGNDGLFNTIKDVLWAMGVDVPLKIKMK